MKAFLLIFLGGGLGSALRYGVSKLYGELETPFPISTFTVNIVGSLIIGLILGLSIKNATINQNTLLFLVTGFCGGFTTFSAFSFENYNLLKAGDYLNFGIYAATSLVIGILFVFIGIWLTKFI